MAPTSGPFFVLAFRSVATALPARYRAAIVALNLGGHHAAVSPWADGDTAWADADGDISIPPTTVPVIAVSPDLNIDLGHLQVLGLGRKCTAKQRGSHQYRRGCRYGESDLRHEGSSLSGLHISESLCRLLKNVVAQMKAICPKLLTATLNVNLSFAF
jgi:hypothetical protein